MRILCLNISTPPLTLPSVSPTQKKVACWGAGFFIALSLLALGSSWVLRCPGALALRIGSGVGVGVGALALGIALRSCKQDNAPFRINTRIRQQGREEVVEILRKEKIWEGNVWVMIVNASAVLDAKWGGDAPTVEGEKIKEAYKIPIRLTYREQKGKDDMVYLAFRDTPTQPIGFPEGAKINDPERVKQIAKACFIERMD